MEFNVQMDLSNWQNIIQENLNKIIATRELESDALQLRANETRSSEAPKSYSVFIIDADGQKEIKKSIINIEPKFTKNNERFVLSVNDDKIPYMSIPEGVEIKKTKAEIASQRTRIIVPNNEAMILKLIDDATNRALDVYKSAGTMFGCCSSFNECSDKKACLYPNKFYTSRCWYRTNLEKGKIFYGKNKNI